MGDPSRNTGTAINEEERGLGASSRGLADYIEQQARRRLKEKAFDEKARAAAEAESAAAAARVNESVTKEREAAADTRRDGEEPIKLGQASAGQTPEHNFPTTPMGDKEVEELKRRLAPQQVPRSMQLLGPGLPLPPASVSSEEQEALNKFLAELSQVSPQKQPGKPGGARHNLGDYWKTFGNNWQSFEPEPSEKATKPVNLDLWGSASLDGTLRLLQKVTIGNLKAAGVEFPTSGADEDLVRDLVTDILYVGPGFFGVFDTRGELGYTPVGSSGRVLSVAAPKTPTGGTYLAYAHKTSVDRYRKQFVVQLNDGIRSQAFLKWGIGIESTFQQRRALHDWSNREGPRIFIISPSYWSRKGLKKALVEAPERLWRMCEIGIQRGYFLKALKNQISNLSAWDIAKMVFWMLVDHLSPIPSLDDFEDATRVATCIGMTIWGGDFNAEQDADVAARILAPEIAGLVTGGALGKAFKLLGKPVLKKALDQRKETKNPPPPTQTDVTKSTTADSGQVAGSGVTPDAKLLTNAKTGAPADNIPPSMPPGGSGAPPPASRDVPILVVGESRIGVHERSTEGLPSVEPEIVRGRGTENSLNTAPDLSPTVWTHKDLAFAEHLLDIAKRNFKKSKKDMDLAQKRVGDVEAMVEAAKGKRFLPDRQKELDIARQREKEAIKKYREMQQLQRAAESRVARVKDDLTARGELAGDGAKQKILRSYSDAELEELIKNTPDIRRVRQLASQMNSGTIGSFFERWANHYVFKKKIGVRSSRLRIKRADNPHITLLKDRSSDFFIAQHGEIWDAKMYRRTREIDVDQLDDYFQMEKAKSVFTRDEKDKTEETKVKSINYLFADEASARANDSLLRVQAGAVAWYVDDGGNLRQVK